VSRFSGGSLVVEITPNVVKRHQADRLREKAGPKSINDEVQLLLRLCGEQGALIGATLRRDKALKLPLPPSPAVPTARSRKPESWRKRRSCARRRCVPPLRWI